MTTLIEEMKERERTRKRVPARGAWYFISVDICPVCGHEEVWRERREGPRPTDWKERHDVNFSAYDWCEN